MSDDFELGYRVGYSDGYQDGFQQGFSQARAATDENDATMAAQASKNSVSARWSKSTAAVIAAAGEATTIAGVIAQVRAAGVAEVVVVVNGATDDTAAIAATAGVKVIEYPDRLGYDIGRAIGARQTTAEIILFLDADFIVSAADLAPFVKAVEQGVDVALNDLGAVSSLQSLKHGVNGAKRFLNLALRRPDLGWGSMTAVPHALSRQALEVIGPENLAVPPLALARAVSGGLNVKQVHAVDVIKPNPTRPGMHQGPGGDLVEQLIIGDHLEALAWLLEHRGARGGFDDLGRKRELVTGIASSTGVGPGL